MFIDLRQYLDRLYNVKTKGSYIVAECPNCKSNKLKINNSTGTFACYANQCSAKKILFKLGIIQVGKAKSNEQVLKKFKAKHNRTILPLDLHKEKISKSYNSIDKLSSNKFTYSEKCYKLKFISNGEKLIIPYENGVKGKQSKWIPYLPIFSDDFSSPNFICVEGEKDVLTLINKLNYTAFTFAYYNSEEIKYGLNYLKNTFNLQGLLIINDNDIIGIKKSKDVENVAKNMNIKTKIIYIKDMAEYYNIPTYRGFDISDLLSETNNFDVIRNYCVK
jgi:hypothetical protein